MDTFKTELLANDLPNSREVPLRQAACWLCGLPTGSLDDFELAGPKQLTKAAIGRTQRSARLWLVVLEHLRRTQDDPRYIFPWQEFGEAATLATVPPIGRRERTAAKLIAAAQAAWGVDRQSIGSIISRWLPVMKLQTERVWAVRGAALEIARNIHSLLPSSHLKPPIVDALRAVDEERQGIRLSLLTNSLDLIEKPSRGGIRGIELWTPIRNEARSPLLVDVTLDREQLIRQFVTLPDTKRDNWITQARNLSHWPVALGLGYLKFDGDMERLYRRADLLSTAGYKDFEILVSPQFIPETPDSDASSEAQQVEQLLREGSLTAIGIRNDGPKLEEISTSEWHYLKLRSDGHPQHICAVDGTRRSSVRLNHIMLQRTQLENLVPPTLPSRKNPLEARQLIVRKVPVDSQQKAFLWKLVDYLEAHAHEPKDAEVTKSRLLQRLDDESVLTISTRNNLWSAARWLLAENAQAIWSGPGRRRSKPSK